MANRHRINSIFFAGEIRKEAASAVGRLVEEGLLLATANSEIGQLREAITDGNILLALTLATTIESRLKTIHGHAQLIINTLETAPSSNGSQA